MSFVNHPFKIEGEWFYWDTAWSHVHGPFPTRARAKEDHDKRCWRDK